MDLNSISKVLIVKLIDLNFFVTILSALVLIFFYKKMDSVLKMSLSIEYHTKSDPPLVGHFISWTLTHAHGFSILSSITTNSSNISTSSIVYCCLSFLCFISSFQLFLTISPSVLAITVWTVSDTPNKITRS